MLTLDDLKQLAKLPRQFKNITLPDGCGQVRIRSWMEAEMSQYQLAIQRRAKKAGFGTDVAVKTAVSLSVVDENGDLLLKGDDADVVDNWPARISQHLFSEIADWNGLTKSEVEELAKNSDAARGDS